MRAGGIKDRLFLRRRSPALPYTTVNLYDQMLRIPLLCFGYGLSVSLKVWSPNTCIWFVFYFSTMLWHRQRSLLRSLMPCSWTSQTVNHINLFSSLSIQSHVFCYYSAKWANITMRTLIKDFESTEGEPGSLPLAGGRKRNFGKGILEHAKILLLGE